MQQFYQNKTIFLTGGTGFLGQIIMEKLLRSCQIDTIYVLIRSKKGKEIAARIEDIANDVVSIKIEKKERYDLRPLQENERTSDSCVCLARK